MADAPEYMGGFQEPFISPLPQAEELNVAPALTEYDFSFPAKQGPVEIVAFTQPDSYKDDLSLLRLRREIELPYQRILALWHRDGVFGQHVGKRDTSGLSERTLTLPPEMAARLLQGMRAVMDPEQPVNCHYLAV